MNKLAFLFLFFFSIFVFSQNETNNWYFGRKPALNFQGFTPQKLNNNKMATKDGCSTISDADGNLLFYSNGLSIYDKNGRFMSEAFPTGGTSVFSQNSIFIPDPYNKHLIYLFTTTEKIITPFKIIEPGLYYTILDTRLNNGNGGIVSLNNFLIDNPAEKISAVHHSNGEDIWIISSYKSENSQSFDKFFCIKLGSTGLSSPIISNTIHGGITNGKGYLKFSPNGEKLVSANSSQGIHIYNFDNTTGEVSNGKSLSTAISDSFPSDFIKPYSVEFSNDSKFVYYTGSNDGINYIFQKKLEEPFKPLQRTIINKEPGDFSSLQLAKNGKIYVTNYTEGKLSNTLSEIVLPEKPDNDCEFSSNSITFDNDHPLIGLPNFIQSYFRTRIITQDVCFNENAEFTLDSYTDITPVSWDFGDGNTSNEATPSHNYNSPGRYLVTAKAMLKNKVIDLYKEIIVFPLPELNENQKLVQCDVNNDGIDYFNLYTIDDKISNLDSGELEYLFYETLTDAELDNNRITQPELYQNKNNPQTIYVRAINFRGCYSIGNFEIESSFVSINEIPALTVCEDSDGTPNDGFGLFDLKQKENDIRLLLSLPDSHTLGFYPSLEEAQTMTNNLDDSLISDDTEIWVRIDNSIGCGGIKPFNLFVNDPKIDLEDNYTICISPSDHPAIVLTADTANDRFEWRDENNTIVNTNNNFPLIGPGEFSLTVYKTINGLECSNFKTFTVNYPQPPEVLSVEVNVQNESENTVYISVNGDSSYEYSLDNNTFFGYGTSHTFSNLQPGIATIYIRDLNKCEPSINDSASIIGYPNFLTPNADGFNDFWKVYGVSSNFFKEIDIRIFNRFGKVLYVINEKNAEIGWDGTYNGISLPSNDYWFHAKLVDLNGNSIDKKGHFTLKRN